MFIKSLLNRSLAFSLAALYTRMLWFRKEIFLGVKTPQLCRELRGFSSTILSTYSVSYATYVQFIETAVFTLEIQDGRWGEMENSVGFLY